MIRKHRLQLECCWKIKLLPSLTSPIGNGQVTGRVKSAEIGVPAPGPGRAKRKEVGYVLKHPEFSEACRAGKDWVERQALKHNVKVDEIGRDGSKYRLRKWIPGNAHAAMKWLQTRRREVYGVVMTPSCAS